MNTWARVSLTGGAASAKTQRGDEHKGALLSPRWWWRGAQIIQGLVGCGENFALTVVHLFPTLSVSRVPSL